MRKWLLLVLLLLSCALCALWAQTGPLPQTSTSLSAVTATGAGTAIVVPILQTNYTWTVTFTTAAPGAQTVNLEGTIDMVQWFTLDTSTSTSYTSATVNGEMRHVVNKPVVAVRCNLASYTQGSNAGVTCNIFQARN